MALARSTFARSRIAILARGISPMASRTPAASLAGRCMHSGRGIGALTNTGDQGLYALVQVDLTGTAQVVPTSDLQSARHLPQVTVLPMRRTQLLNTL